MSNYCPKCGTQTRPNARFCGGCGHDVSSASPSATQSSPPASNPGTPPQAPNQPYGAPPNYQVQSYQPAMPAPPPAQGWPNATPAGQPMQPVYAPAAQGQPMAGEKSLWDRKALLAQNVQYEVAKGGRVESQNDTTAVMVYGKPINNVLHFLLTLFTAGLWLPVWIAVAIFGGEKRKMVVVDEFGNVQIQKV